jgi:site-specific DNA-methyltransferase (adenine-specific)
VRPYYEHGGITIFHGDCREVLPSLRGVSLVLTDPPYGIRAQVDNTRFSGGNQTGPRTAVGERVPVRGDDEPFDPSHLLGFKRLILFGANNFASRLPDSNGWIVWDKRVGLEDMTGWPLGEGELAWTNVTGGIRFFRNRWMGLVRSDEHGEHYHPTQKPVALMAWAIQKWTEPGDLILDPYMGCGTTLRAAKNLGRNATGIEIEEQYCEIAVKRLEQEVLDFGGAA